MNYETMQHLNRERLDRRMHEAATERLVQSRRQRTRRGAWTSLAPVWTRLARPVSGAAGRVTAQPQA